MNFCRADENRLHCASGTRFISTEAEGIFLDLNSYNRIMRCVAGYGEEVSRADRKGAYAWNRMN